jgi:hypothetical protein
MIYDSLFYKNLCNNSLKLKLFKEGLRNGLIQEFDQGMITKLRKLFYGNISCSLYLYGFPTTNDTIGNKAFIITQVFNNYNYYVVCGDVCSTREIDFTNYNQGALNYNTWIEVNISNKIWVYDIISMLKIEKDLYYKLEEPVIDKKTSKDVIINSLGNEDNFYNTNDYFVSLVIVPVIEEYLKYNPYRAIAKQELITYKRFIDYESVRLECISDFNRFSSIRKK